MISSRTIGVVSPDAQLLGEIVYVFARQTDSEQRRHNVNIVDCSRPYLCNLSGSRGPLITGIMGDPLTRPSDTAP